MSRFLKLLIVVPLAALLWGRNPSAQCLLDDHLDGGPCCGLTQAQLPQFPKFVQNALDICWRDCGVDQQLLVRGKWSPLTIQAGTVQPCGEMTWRLDILTPGNTLLWRGSIRLVYSRTWVAAGTAGALQQVWRFLANGDMTNFPAAGAPPCPVPSCAAAFGNRTHFSGYLDFAQDCATPNSFETAWMLTHACDGLDHHSGFTRAGVFHPDRSFSFVGPAAGFVAGPLQPIEGTLSSSFDSVRERTLTPAPVTLACTYEEPVVHTLNPQSQVCFCGLPGSQFLIGDVNIQGPCGTALRTPPVGPLLPGYVSMGIGSWTNPSVYPGQQSLRWNIAGYDVVDICVGTALHQVFRGVTTIGGNPAFQLLGGNPGSPLPPIFIDQASSQKPNGNSSMNSPYTSFYIVNLNE